MDADGKPGMVSAAYPLLSLQSLDLLHVFSVSLLPHRKIARGVIYVVSFRSRRIYGGKESWKRGHREGDAPHHTDEVGPCGDALFPPFFETMLCFLLVALHADFLSSDRLLEK
jgi:hypothetical protein